MGDGLLFVTGIIYKYFLTLLAIRFTAVIKYSFITLIVLYTEFRPIKKPLTHINSYSAQHFIEEKNSFTKTTPFKDQTPTISFLFYITHKCPIIFREKLRQLSLTSGMYHLLLHSPLTTYVQGPYTQLIAISLLWEMYG